MVKRIVIYGYVIPQDRIKGPGSGALVDLVYFVDDQVSISDVINIIVHAGYKIVPKRIGNRRDAPVEADKVQVEDWEQHITQNVTVGSEQLPQNYDINYDRYNYPRGG
jgi:methyl coenzyme M reductase subunit D